MNGPTIRNIHNKQGRKLSIPDKVDIMALHGLGAQEIGKCFLEYLRKYCLINDVQTDEDFEGMEINGGDLVQEIMFEFNSQLKKHTINRYFSINGK